MLPAQNKEKGRNERQRRRPPFHHISRHFVLDSFKEGAWAVRAGNIVEQLGIMPKKLDLVVKKTENSTNLLRT